MAEQDSGSGLMWFVAGAAIGATIALLYAPTSGDEARRIIGKKTREGSQALAESSKDMYDRGRELYERGRKLADEAADMLERGRISSRKPPNRLRENRRADRPHTSKDVIMSTILAKPYSFFARISERTVRGL